MKRIFILLLFFACGFAASELFKSLNAPESIEPEPALLPSTQGSSNKSEVEPLTKPLAAASLNNTENDTQIEDTDENVKEENVEESSVNSENNEETILENTTESSSDYPYFANIFSTESTFEDAKADLLSAIEGEGLVVSYTSHAKTMLENTAAVAGVTTPVYENAEIILFCKADLSHALVGANPHNIVLCPYAIAIYELNKEPGKVYLSFKEPDASVEEVKPIKALLVSIIEEVI